jgi:hypothetical protein
MDDLVRVRALAAPEGGLAVAVTTRSDARPRASVVNAGVVGHPVTGEQVVGFVSRGAVHKLRDLRERPEVTIVFRSGWDWVAVEGRAELAGPDDPLDGLAPGDVPALLRSVYAAAAGGSPEDWAALDDSMAVERHTAVLVRVTRLYPAEP